MECPVCYKSHTDYKLICGHSFCYQCITHWYQDCENYTCPMCRQDIIFVENGDVREVHVQCNRKAVIDDYLEFHELLDRYRGLDIKDVEYLRNQDWVKWVMEYRAKTQSSTRYVFHGLQGTQKTCYQERQEKQKTSVFTKVCAS